MTAMNGEESSKKDGDTASISSRGSLSMDDDWCILTEASINKELVLDMKNPTEVAQLASTYISRQLMQIAEEDMSADIVDKIFKVLTEVGEMDDQILHSFILEFITEQDLWDKQRKKGDDDSKTSHRAVIKMLLELLRFSPVPVENNVLWVKLLAKLGKFPQDIPIMIEFKVAATIMGTMAVHSNIVQIQEHGCRVLEAMAKFKPTPTQKAPVRESGIQVLVMAMEKHHYQPPVIRAACCVLSNLTTTMSEMTTWAMNQGFSDEEAEKLIVMSLDILEYIKEYAMPHLDHTMEAYKEDEIIQTEGLKIKACFGCHSPSQHGFKRSGYSSLKRRQHSILKSTETTKSSKGSTPPRRVTFSHELDTQMEMSDTDSEFGGVEEPKRHTVCGAILGSEILYDSDDGMEDGYEEVADLKLCNGIGGDEDQKQNLKLLDVDLIPDIDKLAFEAPPVSSGEATLLDKEESGHMCHRVTDNSDTFLEDLIDSDERTLKDEVEDDIHAQRTDEIENKTSSYVLVPDCVVELLSEIVDNVCSEVERAQLVEEDEIAAVTVVGDNAESISAALNELESKSISVANVETDAEKAEDAGTKEVGSDKENAAAENSGSDRDDVSIKEQRLTKILDSCLEDKFFTAICSDLEQLQMELETASAMVDEDAETTSSRNTSPFSTLIKQRSYDIDSSCESLPDGMSDTMSNNRSKRIYDDVTIEGLDDDGCIDLQRVVEKEYFSHNSATSPFEQLPNDDTEDYELKNICESPVSSESGYGNEVEVCESPCKLMEVEVQESVERYSEYNEIDIVEALVKAGLLNEEDSNMETTSSENDQERCEDDSSAGEQFSPMMPRSSQRKKLSLISSFNMSTSEEFLDEALTNELPFADFDFINNAFIEEENGNTVNNSDEDNGNGQVRGRPTKREATNRQGSGNFSGSCSEVVVKRRDRSKSGNRRLSAQHRREAFAGNYNHHYEQLAVELERHQSTTGNEGEIEDIDASDDIPKKPSRSRSHVYEQVHPECGGVMLRQPPSRERESLTSSPTSSISSTSISFTEWSDLDAVYERDEEGSIVSADGILESSVMKRQASTEEAIRKETRRRALSHEEDYTPSPPKPRRTWYYTSSADVRKSLVRNSNTDVDVANILSATYARVSKNPRPKPVSLPDIRKTNTNASSDSGVATGDEDLILGTRSHHLYEEVCVNSDGEEEAEPKEEKPIMRKQQQQQQQPNVVRSEVRKTQLLDQDSSEATYSVCTLWVNQECSKALNVFDELTKRLVSPYSILPAAKQLEDARKLSLGSVLDDMEFDFPAWTSILNVLAADEYFCGGIFVGRQLCWKDHLALSCHTGCMDGCCYVARQPKRVNLKGKPDRPKWTMALAAQVLPVVDRLFYTKDEAIMDAAIELVQVLIKKFGKEIEKNHSGGLFRTRYREDCRTCFLWLSKLFTRVSDLLKKEAQKDEDLDSLLHLSLLNSLQGALQPFCHRSSRVNLLKE